ncbi:MULTISPECIES: OmpA family protein [unclassified Actinotalea]|uniref:OmpA family protein n=1 Tax=unclassified Actinotalea TaxID=2638618 RepID=UPI0015F649E2|nr:MULTISPECIES: OmpA family protein [unclassified Actinotalea]
MSGPLRVRRAPLVGVGLAVVLVSGATPSPPEGGPGLVALPPGTATVDVGPVSPLTEGVAPLQGSVSPLITRTASVDGALGRDQALETERWTLASDVYFDVDSAVLTPRAQEDLAQVAAALADAQVVSVTIVGHTDSVASDAYNEGLSRDRAASVQQVLAGILPGVELAVEGRGEREPVAEETGTPEQVAQARALNRRVEIDVVLADQG